MGRLHALVVHFPVGLILGGAVFELAQWARRRPVPSEVGTYCLSLGLGTGIVAVWFGTLNASHQSITGESAEILEWHRYGGWLVIIATISALAVGYLLRRGGRGRARGMYAALVLTSGVLVGTTGHFGGQLVYGSTYISGALPWSGTETTTAATGTGLASPPAPPALEPGAPPADSDDLATSGGRRAAPSTNAAATPTADEVHAAFRTEGRADDGPAASSPGIQAAPPAPSAPSAPPAAPAASAPPPPSTAGDAPAGNPGVVSFARQIEPILRETCVECHGPEKVKARLRMDSVAGLQKGGKSGALFVPGDPDASMLMRRVRGLDDEDQMPLDKDPLTPVQLETLRLWIVQGAHYDAAPSPQSQP